VTIPNWISSSPAGGALKRERSVADRTGKRRGSFPTRGAGRGPRLGSGTPGSTRKAIRWSGALIVIAGALTYANSISGPFVLDDLLSVVHNRQISEWRLGNIFFPERDSPLAGRPLVNLSFAINYATGGLEVRDYHRTNIAVHLLCGLVVLGIVRRTLALPGIQSDLTRQSLRLAFATALIWTVHPLNSEVVDYLST
jgi:hypothetical protein